MVELPPAQSIEESKAKYVAHLATQGKQYYATPDAARRTGINTDNDFSLVTRSKKKRSYAVEPEPVPKKDKHIKKNSSTVYDSVATQTSDSSIRKIRNRAFKDDLAPALDKPKLLFKHARSKSKGRMRQSQNEESAQPTEDSDTAIPESTHY